VVGVALAGPVEGPKPDRSTQQPALAAHPLGLPPQKEEPVTDEHICPAVAGEAWACIDTVIYGPCGHSSCEGACTEVEQCTCTCHRVDAPVTIDIQEER
jgi:hypothetical protein